MSNDIFVIMFRTSNNLDILSSYSHHLWDVSPFQVDHRNREGLKWPKQTESTIPKRDAGALFDQACVLREEAFV